MTNRTPSATDIDRRRLLAWGMPAATALGVGAAVAFTPPAAADPGSKLSAAAAGFVDPEDYGVLDDGEDHSNEWPAVVAAAHDSGRVVYIPAGKTYRGQIRAEDQSLRIQLDGNLAVSNEPVSIGGAAAKVVGAISVLHAPELPTAVSAVSEVTIGSSSETINPPARQRLTQLDVPAAALEHFVADDPWRLLKRATYEWTGQPGMPSGNFWMAEQVDIAGVVLEVADSSLLEADAITGASSGATGLVGSVDGAGHAVLKHLTGVFTAGESLLVGGAARGTVAGPGRVLLKARLTDDFSPTTDAAVEIRRMRSDLRVEIRGSGRITTTGDPDAIVGPSNRPIAVSIAGAVAPVVDGITFENSWDSCVRLISCHRPTGWMRVLRAANNAMTSGGEQAYGYGWELMGSTCDGVLSGEGAHMRHFFTTNCVAYSSVPSSIGSQLLLGTVKRNTCRDAIAVSCWANGFDTHDAAYDTTFINCTNISATGAYRKYSGTSGFQNRAFNTTYVQCTDIGSVCGFIDSTGNDLQTSFRSITRYIGCRAIGFQSAGFRTTNAARDRFHAVEYHGCSAQGENHAEGPYSSVGFRLAGMDTLMRGCTAGLVTGAMIELTEPGTAYAATYVIDDLTMDFSGCPAGIEAIVVGARSGHTESHTLALLDTVVIAGNEPPSSVVHVTGGTPTVQFGDDPVLVGASGIARHAASGGTPTFEMVPRASTPAL